MSSKVAAPTPSPRGKKRPIEEDLDLSSSIPKTLYTKTERTVSSQEENEHPHFQLRPISPLSTSRTNDDIHTSISLCPLTKAILDTPPLQRLRGLHQLGVAEYAYVNVSHTRFEHSLGVMHLAEKLCRRIQTRQPKLNVTEKDVMCVKLAGLCHDLGHGPFSHVFEYIAKDKEWRHEDASIMMIDATLNYLGLEIDESDLDGPLRQIGNGIDASRFRVAGSGGDVMTSRDWIFIKECILGGPLKGRDLLIGRPEVVKEFLYDIVSNRHSGLDVDKIDYYARDKRRALGGGGEVDVMFVEEAVVSWGECSQPDKCFRCATAKLSDDSLSPQKNTHLMIVYPRKLVNEAMGFFKTRFSLHSKVYTHKTSKAAEYLIRDIFELAEPFVELPCIPITPHVDEAETDDSRKTNSQTTVRISESMKNPNCYVHLRDSIIDHIYLTKKKELLPAKRLIERLKARQLYKCVVQHPICANDPTDNDIWDTKSKEDIQEELAQMIIKNRKHLKFQKQHMHVEKREIHHGCKADNPVSLMRFLQKRELCQLDVEPMKLPLAKPVDEEMYASHIPRVFLEKMIRVFCTVTNPETKEAIQLAFETWRDNFSVKMTSCATPKKNQAVLLSQEGSDFGVEEETEDTPMMREDVWERRYAKKMRKDEDEDSDDDEHGHVKRKPSHAVRKILGDSSP